MKNLFIDTTEIDNARIAAQVPAPGTILTGWVRPGRRFECTGSDAYAQEFLRVGPDAFYSRWDANVQRSGLALLMHYLDLMTKENAVDQAYNVLARGCGAVEAAFADFEKRPVSQWPAHWPRP
jgi:hypothetical protein